MRRSGLTRVEIVIVVVVLVVVVGILVKEGEKVRESASRAQTHDNLKQCAIAVHVYHDHSKQLPPGYDVVPRFGEGKQASLWFHILPYIEQGSTFSERNLNAVVPPYLAPSDPSLADSAGLLSFAANLRLFAYETLLANDQPVNEPGRSVEPPVGPMRSGLTFKTIPDGTSNTIMLTTRYADCAGQKTLYAADVFGNCSLGEVRKPGVGGFMGAGAHNTTASPNGDATMMFQLAPAPTRCLPQPAVFGHAFSAGGISVAMCDGSVRNVRPDAGPLNFARALCPADGQPFGPDWNDD